MYIYHTESLLLFHIKMPMGHIAHLRNQFKPINIFAQSIKFITTLIRKIRRKRIVSFFWELNGPICTTLNLLNPRILVPSFVENGLLVLNRRSLNLINVFPLFCYYLPLKEDIIFHLNKLELCFVPSFIEIGPVILQKIFKCHYFVILSDRKKTIAFIWNIWISSTQECFVPILFEICPVVLENKMKMRKVHKQTGGQTDDRRSEKLT